MKKTTLFLAVLLAACQQSTTTSDASVSLEKQMQNPLFAERYSEELVDNLVELYAQQDPILENEEKKERIDAIKDEWLDRAKEAQQLQRKGGKGVFLPMKSYVSGEVLLLKNVVYFSPSFEAVPSTGLQVYLSTTLDPREVSFPDDDSLHLGALQSAYGAQRYSTPNLQVPERYRTVVLWDSDLERLVGFAQLSF